MNMLIQRHKMVKRMLFIMGKIRRAHFQGISFFKLQKALIKQWLNGEK